LSDRRDADKDHDRNSPPKVKETIDKPTYYSCGEPGHYKSECPKLKGRGKGKGKDRKVRRLSNPDRHHLLKIAGTVDGQDCSLILDSGASISLFPSENIRSRDGGSTTTGFGPNKVVCETAVGEIKVVGQTRSKG